MTEPKTPTERAKDVLEGFNKHTNQTICLCESCVNVVAEAIEAAEGKASEAAYVRITRLLDEHPEYGDGSLWDGPCECAECVRNAT